MPHFQEPHHANLSRSDHIWLLVDEDLPTMRFKCCTCGAVTNAPPPFPTPPNWMPRRYEELTSDDRIAAGSRPGKKRK